MRLSKLFAVIAFAALPVVAQRIELDVDPAATKVNWTLGDVLHTVHGTFKLKKSGMWFDPASGQAGGLLVVDAASGESGSNARDSRMHKNVLESARYPDITFAPDRVEGAVARTGDSQVKLHGIFTIHGGTHELLMNVKCHMEPHTLSATVFFTVPYVKWGMRDPSNFVLRVKKEVDIDIEAAGRIR
ncbi:MAG TPA: YceI family protein [Bryobacteraceae bacterium]|nr:YceI family protein [Bryobacteraceae bacterium]